ncbi:MAG: SpoIVB peptidase [Clostridiales bacterium]|nr:SpoIVB peptidase [Clostridiales bacterium]
MKSSVVFNRKIDICVVKKTLAVVLSFIVFAVNFGSYFSALREVPEEIFAENREDLIRKLEGSFSFTDSALSADSSFDETVGKTFVSCRLFGFLTVKKVTAYVSERAVLIPGGQAVGISIYTDGVLVVGIGSFLSLEGRSVSPAKDAGIEPGDIILSVNGVPIATSIDLSKDLSLNSGHAELLIERNGQRKTVSVVAAKADNGEFRIGAWVRDSTVGIGTLSFYDTESCIAASLGHAVVDSDTGSLLKVKDGKLVLAEVIGVTPGRQGFPGELHGTFDESSPVLGSIEANTELGIFGILSNDAMIDLGGTPIEIAFPDEVRTGDAVILSSVDGTLKPYACRIIKTGRQFEPAPKGIVIEITDERLLEITGGIVQGMSGSPIIQNGRLVGAVTHVFINDPMRGYGAYAYWIYKLIGGL